MQVKLAILADGANLSREGKLNVLGIFDTVFARSFPTTHAQMQLVVRFEATAAEIGTTHTIDVQLLAPAGPALFQLSGTLTVPQPVLGGDTVGVDHILSFANVRFEAPGRHAFRIAVDGAESATVPLRVEQVH